MPFTEFPKTLFTELAVISDERVLYDLPRLLVSTLEAEMAYIGLLKDDDRTVVAEYLYTNRDSTGNDSSGTYTYDVSTSPCASTIQHGRFGLPEGCDTAFDRMPFFKKLKVQGYAGVTLLDGSGTVCGVLVILSAKRLANAERLLAGLELIGNRVSSVLVNNRKADVVKEEHALLQSLINAVPYPIFCKDHEGRYLECNPATEKILGMTRQELLRKTMNEVVPKDLISECYVTERKIFSGEISEVCHDGPLTLPDGEVRKFRFYKAGIGQSDEKLRAVACSFLDITEQEQACVQLKEKQIFLQSVIDNVVEPIMVVGQDKKVLLLNHQAKKGVSSDVFNQKEIYCHSVCRALDTPCRGGMEPCPVDEVMITGEKVTLLQKFETDDGKLDLYETVASPYKNDRNEAVGVIHWSRNVSDRDNMVSQLDEQEQRLHFLAYHDHLTQLPNRLNFQERLHRALSRNRRDGTMCALMFVDLDRFKVINDSLGHDIGDLVLKKVAERLKKTIRQTDTVARFGGDEFLILLEGMHESSQSALLAKKIINQFESPVRVRDLELSLTASIGICLSLQDGNDSESLIKNAEIAMYRGKSEGRNTYTFYNRKMDCFAHEQLEQESRLRKGIKNGEMQLHYQPQIDLVNNKVIGFEGLLRWSHPEQGMISPEQFIPLAEETGLIVSLGEWCIDQSCQFICRLSKLGMSNFRVAVNISPRHFRQKGIVDFIDEVLEATGADPTCLELEITEGTIMEDVEMAIFKMTQLSKRGIALAIDDFGTGYSSLAYLQKFPVSKLKIDRTFISALREGNEDVALVSAIVALAKSMNLSALAEGVETSFQIDALLEIGCTQVQGFFFSKALPEGEALSYAENFNLENRWIQLSSAKKR